MENLYREVLCLLLASSPEDVCRQDIQDLFQRHGGRRNFQRFKVLEAGQLRRSLENCTTLFEVESIGRNSASVRPTSSLTICRTHSNKGGSCRNRLCPGLHLCIFYLLSGQCKYRHQCHFGHALDTAHNKGLLQRHRLWGVSITELRVLFRLPRVRRGVTMPQVCRYYNLSKGCTKGPDRRCLHMCQDYISDECRFVDSCERSHNMKDPQVTKVLTLYGVEVKRRSADVLDEVRFYDQKHEDQMDMEEALQTDLPGPGAKAKRCGSVPRHFSRDKFSLAPISYGTSGRAQSVGRPSNSSLSLYAKLAGSGFSQGTSGRAQSVGRPSNSSLSPYAKLAGSGFSQPKTQELCLYHLQGACRYSDACNRLHSSELFLWRLSPDDGGRPVDDEGGLDWRDFPPDSNRTLEKAFSQPQETKCTVTDQGGDELEVDFRTRTAQNHSTGDRYQVRRFSTMSSMHSSFKRSASSRWSDIATVWLWYWRKDGVWSEFGLEENGRLPVTSDVVEENYQMSASTTMPFDHYVLTFGNMRLKDTDTGCMFKVRRRPQFKLMSTDAESDSQSDSDSAEEERETDNDDDDDRDEDDDDKDDEARAGDISTSVVSVASILQPVSDSSQTAVLVMKRFLETIEVSCTVLAIHRVQNPQLEAQYEKRMKFLMRKESCDKSVEEKLLYYRPPSDEDTVAVYTHGVGCSNPMKGSTPNKEHYFYVNASRANKNVGSKPKGGNVGSKPKGEHCMFVMKCLVGGPLVALSSAVRPADSYRGGSGCYVDNVSNPKTFVFSDPSQVCPIFLIIYRLS